MADECDRLRVDLRTHFDQRLTDMDQRLREQRDDLKDRLAAMNEFREALKDQSGQMATRDQLDQLRERVTENRIHVASIAAGVSLIISLLSAVIARFLLVWPVGAR